jgi:hypothetical protein
MISYDKQGGRSRDIFNTFREKNEIFPLAIVDTSSEKFGFLMLSVKQ